MAVVRWFLKHYSKALTNCTSPNILTSKTHNTFCNLPTAIYHREDFFASIKYLNTKRYIFKSESETALVFCPKFHASSISE